MMDEERNDANDAPLTTLGGVIDSISKKVDEIKGIDQHGFVKSLIGLELFEELPETISFHPPFPTRFVEVEEEQRPQRNLGFVKEESAWRMYHDGELLMAQDIGSGELKIYDTQKFHTLTRNWKVRVFTDFLGVLCRFGEAETDEADSRRWDLVKYLSLTIRHLKNDGIEL